eukprot:SAG22_NODE_5445_length_1013_cov_0.834792_1_plen_28_part_10
MVDFIAKNTVPATKSLYYSYPLSPHYPL